MEIFGWVIKHWVDLFQSVGIVGGLLFTGISLKIDAGVRRVQNLLKVTEHHRNIWSRLYDNPSLGRVTNTNLDLQKFPPTREEELFVQLLVLHLNSVYNAIEHGMFSPPDRLKEDIRQFFSKPIPRNVWLKVRELQDGDFVLFVDKNIS